MGHGKISAKALCFIGLALLYTTSSPTLSSEITPPRRAHKPAPDISLEEMQELLDPSSPCGLNMQKVHERQTAQRERGKGDDIATRIMFIQQNKTMIQMMLQEIKASDLAERDQGYRFDDKNLVRTIYPPSPTGVLVFESNETPIDQLSPHPNAIRGLIEINNAYTQEILRKFPTLTPEKIARISAPKRQRSMPRFDSKLG